MKVAYVRVSTIDQNPERQVEALKKFGIEKWYKEKISGKNMEREEVKLMLDFVREGDEVYVTDFSRLSRSLTDLLNIVELLSQKKVRLVSIKENFDTDTPTGKLMLTLIAAINEFERMNMLERQREGIAIAKKAGKYKGRREKELDNFDEVYQSWKNREITAVNAAKLLGVSRYTFYNRIKKHENAVASSQ